MLAAVVAADRDFVSLLTAFLCCLFGVEEVAVYRCVSATCVVRCCSLMVQECLHSLLCSVFEKYQRRLSEPYKVVRCH